MPRRISRLGGTTLRRSFMTNAYSPGIYTWGPRNGPQSPHHSDRPGGAVAILYLTLTLGGAEMALPPHHSDRPGGAVAGLSLTLTLGGAEMALPPPSFGPPRRSRGGPSINGVLQAAPSRRRCSGIMQRSCTTRMPARASVSAAPSWRMPSWNQTTEGFHGNRTISAA